MLPFFKKKATPEKFFEIVMKQQEDDNKIGLLGVVMLRCKGKYRYVGEKVITEVLKLSKDPVKDLKGLLRNVNDKELAEDIVDRIAGYGMEKTEVHKTLFIIGDDTILYNKAAKKRARQHYDRY